jgi:hypothetical protein
MGHVFMRVLTVFCNYVVITGLNQKRSKMAGKMKRFLGHLHILDSDALSWLGRCKGVPVQVHLRAMRIFSAISRIESFAVNRRLKVRKYGS